MRDSELSMLSTLSLTEHSAALDVPHHDSITPSHSTSTATAMTSSTRPHSNQPQHVRGNRQAPPTPLPHGHPQDWGSHHELRLADKENISPSPLNNRKSVLGSEAPVSSSPQKAGGSGATTSASGHPAAGTGLVLFPEKHVNVSSKSAISSSSSSISAPSPHTREMLRQQELQLRHLQEQVCTCIRFICGAIGLHN